VRIQAFGKSDVGRVRTNNEDSIGLLPENPAGELPHNNVFLVADGMGGQAAGEVASRLTVETVLDAYRNAPDDGGSADPGEAALYLEQTLIAANHRILDAVEKDSSLDGMGATVVAAHLENGAIYVAHAGDSRCYRFRGDQLERLTRDHSVVQELVDAGKIEEDEMITHPRRNVVLRAMGTEADLEFELSAFEVEEGDLFLFCSDGLCGAVTDKAIGEVFVRHPRPKDLEPLCDDFITLANETDGSDNVSVVLLKVQGSSGSIVPGGATAGLVALFVGVVAVLALGMWWLSADPGVGASRLEDPVAQNARNPAVVHVGDYGPQTEAVLERDRLVSQGFESFIVVGRDSVGPRHRLFVEGGSNLQAAAKMVKLLRDAGHESDLVPVEFPYALQVEGVYRSRSDAIVLRDRLQEAGFFPYLTNAMTDSGLTSRVLIGVFTDSKEADGLGREVAERGWRSEVVYR